MFDTDTIELAYRLKIPLLKYLIDSTKNEIVNMAKW